MFFSSKDSRGAGNRLSGTRLSGNRWAEIRLPDTSFSVKRILGSSLTAKVLFLILCVFKLSTVEAEPYLAVHTKQTCAACHVNPNGGGMRTDFGRVYGNTSFSARQGSLLDPNLGRVNSYLSLGGNFRFLSQSQETPASQDKTSGFETQSGQVYLQLSHSELGIELYLDQKVMPDESETRELFLIKRLQGGDYIKAGKMIPQLGLRLEDDTALIRQSSGFNFNNNDLGIEYGVNWKGGLHSVSINTGSSDTSNPDGKYRTILRSEFYIDNWRLGGALSANPGNGSKSSSVSLFGGYQLGDWVFLADVSMLEEDFESTSLQDKTQLMSLIEVNYLFQPGHNIKLTEEYLDPDRDLSEDEQVRHSLVYEYTPYPNVQFRAGIRDREAPPQIEQLNIDTQFLQVHFYF